MDEPEPAGLSAVLKAGRALDDGVKRVESGAQARRVDGEEGGRLIGDRGHRSARAEQGAGAHSIGVGRDLDVIGAGHRRRIGQVERRQRGAE